MLVFIGHINKITAADKSLILMKLSFLIIIMLISGLCFAHQPNLSTTVVSKTKEGAYILQISSSLHAFEGEIDFNYGKNAYKTPEEFKNLVVEHFNKNIRFIVNGRDTLKFINPIVVLGHESKLIAEVVAMPEKIESFYFENTIFKNIHRNKMLVILLPDGFPKKQIVLEKDNHHIISLFFSAGEWQPMPKQEIAEKKIITQISDNTANNNSESTNYLVFVFVLVGLIPIYFLYKKAVIK